MYEIYMFIHIPHTVLYNREKTRVMSFMNNGIMNGNLKWFETFNTCNS